MAKNIHEDLSASKDAICSVLSEISNREDFPVGSVGLATVGLISALAEHYEELPKMYLESMFPSLALLFREVIENSVAANSLIDEAKND